MSGQKKKKKNQHHTQDSIKNCHHLQLVGRSRVPSDKITHADCSNSPLWERAVAQHWEYAQMEEEEIIEGILQEASTGNTQSIRDLPRDISTYIPQLYLKRLFSVS